MEHQSALQLGEAQQEDEAMLQLIQWIKRPKVAIPQGLQGLLQQARQLNNQFDSLQLIDGIFVSTI